jgi:hypothetical protein
MELRKIYYRVGIHKLIKSVFNTFVIYSILKLQIDNSLGVLFRLRNSINFKFIWIMIANYFCFLIKAICNLINFNWNRNPFSFNIKILKLDQC